MEEDNRRKQLVFLSRLLEKQRDDKLEFQEWFCQKDMFAKVVGEKLLKDWFPAMVRRLSITLTDMTSNFCLCASGSQGRSEDLPVVHFLFFILQSIVRYLYKQYLLQHRI
jgi:hypothetical protein